MDCFLEIIGAIFIVIIVVAILLYVFLTPEDKYIKKH